MHRNLPASFIGYDGGKGAKCSTHIIPDDGGVDYVHRICFLFATKPALAKNV